MNNFFIFWIQIFFDLYIFVLMLQFLFLLSEGSFFNPATFYLSRLTDPVIKPLQKIWPRKPRIVWAYLLVIIILDGLKLFLIYYFRLYQLPNITGLALWLLGDLVMKFINFYFYTILLRVILSWIATAQLKSLYFLLAQITEPLLRPVRRILPSVAGFDFSPWVVMVALQLVLFLVVIPLTAQTNLML